MPLRDAGIDDLAVDVPDVQVVGVVLRTVGVTLAWFEVNKQNWKTIVAHEFDLIARDHAIVGHFAIARGRNDGRRRAGE
ncbi:MAG: hypothetical protein C4547_14635 [Phycisphaerales bacterium]|nr:MAG: hypothetical protein C4547_14635 [Phycisphaerales bacterium]